MFDPKTLESLARRAARALPPGLEQVGEELRSNVKAAVGAAIERTDSVSRDEFDVQSAVLRRTREKLEALERRVAELEALVETRSAPG